MRRDEKRERDERSEREERSETDEGAWLPLVACSSSLVRRLGLISVDMSKLLEY